jgi:upstream activation factor subunit UAF30
VPLTKHHRCQVAIKALIEARFDAISADALSADAIPTPPSPTSDVPPKLEANGHSPSEHSEDTAEAKADSDVDGEGEIEVATQPAKKKQKRESSTEDADARLAARLQAQEERLARGRTTRGGVTAKGSKKAKPKKSTPKKKSEKRVRDDSDDAASGSESGEKVKKKGGGFQKPFNLSYPLAELCGVTQVGRSSCELLARKCV